MSDAIIERLGAIFVESLRIEAPPPDTDLFESGTIDSLQLIELLLQIERRFGVQIAIESIDLDRLRTLERIEQLMEELQPRVAEIRARRVRSLR